MHYEHIVPAAVLERPNRFIAHVDLDGKEEIGQSHLYEAVGYRSLEEKYW